MKYYEVLIRSGPEVSKDIIVQARSEKNARNILTETHMVTSNEEIMDIIDVSNRMGEKQKLQDFLDEMNETNDVDMLICTGGKTVNTLTPSF